MDSELQIASVLKKMGQLLFIGSRRTRNLPWKYVDEFYRAGNLSVQTPATVCKQEVINEQMINN